ncbi:MAG: cytoplasmic protein [Rickettsiales bacterium]|nr:cytoplasmic protein [Rickettsiales bacterium]
MRKPLMPKATAVWLIENTSLSFKQISDFVGLHMLEVQAIADGEVSSGILPRNPLENGELSEDEIKKCEKNIKLSLKIRSSDIPMPKTKTKGSRYTPLSKRADKPNGIYWLLKNLPDIPDSKICKIIGTTKNTIKSIKERTFWNMQNIRAQNPFELGLCSKEDLDKIIEKYKDLKS